MHTSMANKIQLPARMSFRDFLGRLMLTVALSLAVALPISAQQQPANQLQQPAADPDIVAALQDVSSAAIQRNIEKLVSFGTRLTLSAQDPQSISAGRGIGAARELIKSEFTRYSKECGGCLEVKTDTFTQERGERVPQPTVLTNVYAVLKGTEPGSAKRIVLVTGHYDSRNSDTFDSKGDAPGANDDGSGTAVSLECARILSKHKFPATIIFLTVAGEEQGLDGSLHFAKLAKAEGWDLEAALNNDIVGGDRNPDQNPNIVRVFSEGLPQVASEAQIGAIRGLGGESDSPSRELARYVSSVAKTYSTGVEPMMLFRLDRYLRGGDHISFNEQGYAAVRFTEYREDFHHQHQNIRTENGIEYGDLPKFVNFEYVSHVAKLNAATLASLAAAPAPPANVHLETRELTNDSTLKWDPSPGGHATAYEVLWRATTSPDWEHAARVDKGTSVTLPISKDNVIFAVQAVDEKDHRSLPVVPSPQR
jgi:hypothetical protein